MLSDKDYEDFARPLIELYSNIERELLQLIASKFDIYDPITGSLEWHIAKLDELGGLNREAVKVIARHSKKTQETIYAMLNDVGYKSIPYKELTRVFDLGGTLINPKSVSISKVIENCYKETDEVFKLIQTSAVEGTKEAYMNILNQTYLEVEQGIYDHNTSIKKGMQKMADRGITVATYKTKTGKIRKLSIETVVRRDTVSAINKTANKANDKMTAELGAKHTYVSEHLGARNSGVGHINHESWQGQVFLLVGENKEFKNFKKTTGYGLVDGIGGVNCRHLHWAFFPGISEIPKRLVDDEENSRVYELIKEQRKYERSIRKYKKCALVAKEIDDPEESKKANKEVKKFQAKLRELIKSNPELRRQQAREKIVN